MRQVICLVATLLVVMGLFIWLLWKHTLFVLILSTLLVGSLYLLAAIRNRGRHLQAL